MRESLPFFYNLIVSHMNFTTQLPHLFALRPGSLSPSFEEMVASGTLDEVALLCFSVYANITDRVTAIRTRWTEHPDEEASASLQVLSCVY